MYPCFLFFFNDTATTEIYTLSLHDALPISVGDVGVLLRHPRRHVPPDDAFVARQPGVLDDVLLVDVLLDQVGDRKSTRLNSSHPSISYAVFCLKKKNRDTPN